jgi:hypothetical protein
MSEQESNTCPVCGGVKRIDWTISFEECHPVQVQFDPASLAGNWRLCPGHPEPAADESEQDIIYGDLGDHVAVWHDESWGYDQIAIRGKGEVRTDLRPQQFLALLDWGMRHRKAIERLAKEIEQG